MSTATPNANPNPFAPGIALKKMSEVQANINRIVVRLDQLRSSSVCEAQRLGYRPEALKELSDAAQKGIQRQKEIERLGETIKEMRAAQLLVDANARAGEDTVTGQEYTRAAEQEARSVQLR